MISSAKNEQRDRPGHGKALVRRCRCQRGSHSRSPAPARPPAAPRYRSTAGTAGWWSTHRRNDQDCVGGRGRHTRAASARTPGRAGRRRCSTPRRRRGGKKLTNRSAFTWRSAIVTAPEREEHGPDDHVDLHLVDHLQGPDRMEVAHHHVVAAQRQRDDGEPAHEQRLRSGPAARARTCSSSCSQLGGEPCAAAPRRPPAAAARAACLASIRTGPWPRRSRPWPAGSPPRRSSSA